MLDAQTHASCGLPTGIELLVHGPATRDSLAPTKVFAAPFRLAFKKGENVAWLEVRTLDGLRRVAEKLDEGTLKEIDRFSTLEMQLWGHLAEHNGFLRAQASSTSSLAAGIMPLGADLAPLADDIASIMGGDDTKVLNTLADLQRLSQGAMSLASTEPADPIKSAHAFVKEDGINLTTEGEDALRELVLGENKPNGRHKKPNPETIAFEKSAENAVEIFLSTPSPPPETIREAAPALLTGPEANHVGRLVAEAGRGLDRTEDAQVQHMSKVAADLVLNKTTAEVSDKLPGLAQFDTTLDEVKRLSKTSTERAQEAKKRDGAQDPFFKNITRSEPSRPPFTVDGRPVTDVARSESYTYPAYEAKEEAPPPSQPSGRLGIIRNPDALPEQAEFDPKNPYKQKPQDPDTA